MNLERYLLEKKKTVDAFLKKYIASKKNGKDCPAHLRKAMEYSLTAGGKRIRPVLAIAAYEAVGGKSARILPIASSLELIHTYSLIHDDLPAMDDDDFRRGFPTNHKVFGEAIAILAGDALLTDAFTMIAGADISKSLLVHAIRELAYASGPEGMVGGQAADIMLEGKKPGKKDVYYIHTHKTGALIRASVRIGAIGGNASPAKLKALTVYGEKTGLAFQVTDDILNVTGTKEELGKSAGSDMEKGKITYPSTFGLKRSEEIAEQLVNEALEALKGFDKKADPLREIAKYISKRKS